MSSVIDEFRQSAKLVLRVTFMSSIRRLPLDVVFMDMRIRLSYKDRHLLLQALSPFPAFPK
jgi:hypothetical protein